ncbi:type I polyketide synthase [Microbispora catharanthi]|uniref:Acyltransferase domain-containing protein n=1 Tax=Microbispora catharanthi TaxID=1712871 RepID=A0A5N6BE62_9ACTN|nr:type I polyketide synthase [Microbispora catharanthi]KAB8178313.1 acyltransferase domain-containing protein [Microbispora catharanthi]
MSMASVPPRDPIAIIGAGCRLPGASGPSAFWDVLAGERDAVGEIPPGRFPGAGGIGTRAGGFLDDIDSFDASFFSISPHEALRIDPQHRLLIEVTWEAIEDAGIPLHKLAGSRTAVYTSCLWSDYWDRLRGAGMYDMHAAIGGGNWGNLPGRISYLFDLRGPSMSVEATCSTSLVAVHLACRELWAGQTDMAVVGGVNLLMAPDIYLGLSDAGILSPEGRCRFGDADADGYVRSEAVVSLLLKPLRRALADGDRVYASIVGTAVNSNGRGAGTLIAAGVSGQEAMLREAYRDAGVRPGQIDYVEAHGPGTPSGDLTELTALARVMGEGREPGQRCLVGSAKSNIGHGEGAAGLVGLLKAALALRHRTVPATLNVRRPHPLFEQPGMPLELVRRTREWPERSWPAMAGVSSFGLSATNAHVVLAEAPPVVAARRRRSGTYLLPLSARDERALPDLALRYADALQPSNSSPHDLCFSAGDRRSHHGHRVAVVGTNGRGIAAALRSYAAGAAPQSVVTGQARAGVTPKVVYVFPGQGAQWPGMARDLLDDNLVFARRLRECDRAIHDELGWSLIDLLREGRPLSGTDEIQPALWAIQVALASVWAAWGIRPDLVIGHSMGEIAAATASGALTVRQGAAVVCRRSRLLTRLGGSGEMWAVQVGELQAREAIGENADRVCVAVVNSVHSCVLAGDADALGEVVERLRRDGAFCKQVQVAYASHAPQMDPIRDDLIEALAELRPRPGAVPMHSTMLDEMVDGSQLDAGYWMENLRRPVCFASAVRAALPDEGPVLFIEISPHPLLASAIEDEIAAAAGAGTVIPSLCRDEPGLECMLRSLGVAYVQGCDPDWSRLYPGGRFTPLPGYPWQRRRFWVDPRDSAAPAFAAAALPAVTGPYTVTGVEAVPGVEPAPGRDDVTVSPVLVSSASVSSLSSVASVSSVSSVPSVSVGDVIAGPAALVGPGPVAALPAVPVAEAAAAGPDGDGMADPPLTDRSVAAAAITRYVVMRSARILGMSPDELDLDSPITVHGLDSVLAAKLSAQIQADLGVHVRVGELLRHRPLSNLTGELYEAASLRASGR